MLTDKETVVYKFT